MGKPFKEIAVSKICKIVLYRTFNLYIAFIESYDYIIAFIESYDYIYNYLAEPTIPAILFAK